MSAIIHPSVLRLRGVRAGAGLAMVCLVGLTGMTARAQGGGNSAAPSAAPQSTQAAPSAAPQAAPTTPPQGPQQGSQPGQKATPASVGTQAAPGNYSLQMRVPLVVEDVVVLDRDNRPVHGLKATDFSVSEEGKPMELKNFEEHAAVKAAQSAAPKLPYMGMNVFTNVTTTPMNSALNILLLDALNTPMADQAYVRQQMLKYLKTLQPGLRIAIFGLGTRLYLLQGFTSDQEVLKTVIEGKGAGSKASPLIDDPVTGGPVEQMSDITAEMAGNDPTMAAVIANMQQFEAETATFQTTMREIYTLEAMNELARYLAGLPGRKNLIWFSGSFPLNIMPDDSLNDPFAAMADYSDDMRKTTDLLARSQVAVYPVDARGLFSNPAMNASQSGAGFTRNPQAFAKSQTKFFTQTTSEHSTMDMMAENTGGKAFYNTNGLKEAVEQAIDMGSNYYSFSYTPENLKWNGAYRKIVVKTNQPGLHLDYRKGYFADDPETLEKGQKVLPQTAMQIAMMRGGPDPTQLVFQARVTPDDVTSDKLSEGAHPSPKLMKPPYRNYVLDTVLDLRRVKMTAGDDGTYQGSLEYVAAVYDADGQAVNLVSKAFHMTLKKDQYAALLKNGLVFRMPLDAPAKGDYFFRVGVHDLTGDKVGALEVPVSVLKTKQAMIDEQTARLAAQQKSAPAKQ